MRSDLCHKAANQRASARSCIGLFRTTRVLTATGRRRPSRHPSVQHLQHHHTRSRLQSKLVRRSCVLAAVTVAQRSIVWQGRCFQKSRAASHQHSLSRQNRQQRASPLHLLATPHTTARRGAKQIASEKLLHLMGRIEIVRIHWPETSLSCTRSRTLDRHRLAAVCEPGSQTFVFAVHTC